MNDTLDCAVDALHTLSAYMRREVNGRSVLQEPPVTMYGLVITLTCPKCWHEVHMDNPSQILKEETEALGAFRLLFSSKDKRQSLCETLQNCILKAYTDHQINGPCTPKRSP